MSEPKYYSEWDAKPEHELPREEAEKLSMYARGWHRPDGSVERLEIFDGGKLARVDYFDARDAEVEAAHRAHYPGIVRMIHRQLASRAGFGWHAQLGTRADGTVTARGVVLMEPSGNDIMNVEHDERGSPTGVTKYRWDDSGELAYMFSYDGDGRLVGVHDVEDGTTTSFDDLRPHLPDPAFYETGFALPAAIASTPIPVVVLRARP